MKTINVSLIFFLIILSFASCRKDSITTDLTPIPNEPTINIETTLNGFITGRNGEAIPNAAVSILNSATQTNELGFFEITGLVNEKFAVIKVEKSGYFNQFETLIPSKNSINRTRIQLTEKGSPETISSNAGGQISISQNSSVDFQANSFVDEQGNVYNGNVNIYSFYIDPTDPDIDQFMPGNMMARNTENDLRILESFGMINVELEGDAGQKLNINKSATLTVEVPNSIANNAPTEIPLWHFDEEKGLWMEEGNATLQNGKYVGDVEHFTFWNCDVPRTLTVIQGHVISSSEDLPIFKVTVTNLDDNTFATSYTDNNGYFGGGVPMNVPLLLEIFDLCGDLVFSDNIGPFSTPAENLGDFNITSSLNIITISGTLIDCDGNPISNGQIIITGGFINQQATVNSDGTFTATTTTCGNNEVSITGIDYDNTTIGASQIFTVSSNMNVGDLVVCGTLTDGVFIFFDGATKYFPNCTVTITPSPAPSTTITYDFQFKDIVSNGTEINYFFNFDDFNGDLTNPNFDLFSFFTLPDPYVPFTGHVGHLESSSTFELLTEATNPGELMTFKFDNMLMDERIHLANGDISVTTFPASSIILTGVLQ